MALGLLIASAIARGLLTASALDIRWTYCFAPSTFIFFMLGHFARQISYRNPSLKTGACGAILMVCCLTCLHIGTVGWDGLQFWAATLFFAASLPGIFEATRKSAFLRAVGDLSFPVYLIHLIVITVISSLPIMASLPKSSMIVVPIYLAAIIVASIASHWCIEKPISSLMRSAIRHVNDHVIALTAAARGARLAATNLLTTAD
jgi:peptidoglycan/LPS O-acetylase OafA/YrhL